MFLVTARRIRMQKVHELWTFSALPRVSNPDVHHGKCVTHVPWCLPGSLTSSSLWCRWRGKRSRHSRCMRTAQFYVSGKRPIAVVLRLVSCIYNQETIDINTICNHTQCSNWNNLTLPQRIRDFMICHIASGLFAVPSIDDKINNIKSAGQSHHNLWCFYISYRILSGYYKSLNICQMTRIKQLAGWGMGCIFWVQGVTYV